MLQAIGEVDSIDIITLLDDSTGFEPNIISEHGISILLDMVSGKVHKKILFDTGQSGTTIIHNMEVLKLQPENIDMIVLSHCHRDHSSGVIHMLNKIGKNIPVVAHNEIFRENFSMTPFLRPTGIKYTKEQITSNGGDLILIRNPIKLMDGVVYTGQVERNTDFESHGIKSYNIENGEEIYDYILDDISLVVNIKNKGLLIITGCGHSGIINIVKHSIKIMNNNNIYGIIGGLHLIDSSNEVIEKTVNELLKFDLKLIIPGHCTGIMAMSKIKESFGGKCEFNYSGKTIKL